MLVLDIIEKINKNGVKTLEQFNDKKYFYPLKMYYKTKRLSANIEYLTKKKDSSLYVIKYVERTLKILKAEKIKDKNIFDILETTLLWSDIAKAGTPAEIRSWKAKKYDLYVHNLGSAMIYSDYCIDEKNKEIITILIKTHGLIGQYIRGETKLKESAELTKLLSKTQLDYKVLYNIIYILNKCIIKAVNEELWNRLEDEIRDTISNILGDKIKELDFIERVKRLRGNKKENIEILNSDANKSIMSTILKDIDLWYVEAALSDFNINNFIKIFYLIYKKTDLHHFKNLSFEKFMYNIYYDRKDIKNINLYKKRIIEKYLNAVDVNDNIIPLNEHVEICVERIGTTLLLNFKFSEAASKLIEFCEVAEKTNSLLYEKSIIMLYDLFEFRKDDFDWFYNEKNYLKTMNQTITYKSIILDYIIGDYIIDVGPGGGALLNAIEERFDGKKIVGIDISKNVIEELEKYKRENNKKWDVMQVDILKVTKYINENAVDTIIFSSVIHELFSYIETEGKKFNLKTVIEVLKKAYHILKPGGRIIIRDGIMTEPNNKRIIEFKTKGGINFFNNYVKDFKGRVVECQYINNNRVILPVNDAMEFLYTYTWGIDSYPREIQEQFGYYTPTEFKKCINDNLKNSTIIEFRHFLQDGYEEHLLPKINIYDEQGQVVKLPDSTCFIVVEKGVNNS